MKLHALEREVLPPPDTLDIVANEGSATFTSNDGTVRIDRIVPAETSPKKGAPDGITLQTP